MINYKRRQQTKVELKTRYDKEAQTYDAARSGHRQGRIVDMLQIQFIKRKIKPRKGKKLLEVGCGTGRILLPLAKTGVECYGVDAAKNMLSRLQKKAAQMNVKIHFKQGDIEKIPFKANTFDAVYTMHVLMHLPDYKKAVNSMHRVLKPGGTLVLDFPNANSPWTKLSVMLNPGKKRTRLFSISELRKSFASYDYELDGLFSWPHILYKMPVIRGITLFLEKNLPLPVSWRTQLFIVIKK